MDSRDAVGGHHADSRTTCTLSLGLLLVSVCLHSEPGPTALTEWVAATQATR